MELTNSAAGGKGAARAAAIILASGIAKYLDTSQVATLQRHVDREDTYDYIGLEVFNHDRAGGVAYQTDSFKTSAQLNYEVKNLPHSKDQTNQFRRIVKENGSVWTRMASVAGVSWCSHTTTGSADAKARLAFYAEIADVVEQLEREAAFDEEVMIMTAGDAAAAEAERQRNLLSAAQDRAMKIITSTLTIMQRRGQTRIVPVELISDIAPGVHTARVGQRSGDVREFNVSVARDRKSATITRLS